MFKIWGIVRKNNKIIKDIVAVSDEPGLSKDQRLSQCIQKICYEFDLQRPIWLPKNQREYKEYRRAVLTQDNFIESIDFDALEIELIDD